MGADSRKQMIRSAALLFREHGYSGTGFRDVIAHSGAPRGSIYHHFPGGKAQLGAETVRAVGERIGVGLDALAEQGDPIAMLRMLVAGWRQTLVENEFRAGCPIVAVAAESHPDAPELADAAAEAFARWQEPLSASLRKAGVKPARARRLAALITASIEGAIVLGRATRSAEPLDNVGRELEAAVRAALPTG
jgi:AcrR family transcriptional regulator